MRRFCFLLVVSALAATPALADSDSGTHASRPARAAPPGLLAKIPSPFAAVRRQAAGTYVGSALNHPEAPYLGLVVEHGKVAAYICDGKRLAEWFGGAVSHGRLDLVSARGSHLVGAVGRSGFRGTLTLRGGSPIGYAAKPAARVNGGLFRVRDRRGVTGWILVPPGLRGATESGGKATLPVSEDAGSPSGSSGTSGTNTTAGGGGGCIDAISGGCAATCNQLKAQFTAWNNAARTATSQAGFLAATKEVGLVLLQEEMNGC
jgi:hypothetical protein